MKLKLVKPSFKYKNNYINFIIEAHREGRRKKIKTKSLKKDFSSYLKKIKQSEKGQNLKQGKVPASMYWLVKKGRIIGQISFRHQLTENLLKCGGHVGYEIRSSERQKGYGKEILRLGLKKAKKKKLQELLLTCDDENIASSKIIEANGGQFQDKVVYKDKTKRRYWIKI